MEPKSSLTHNIPNDFGDHPWGYGGAIPLHITSQKCYNNTGRKTSKIRLNDQLIPKPTDINLGEKMIQIATPKEHPYSSHISRFAMFPSFRSPDDPETGVRAASQPFLSLIMPHGAPDISLLSKTKGAPHRHEIIETPVKTKKTVKWTGEHGFYDKTKLLKGENQVFYPTPPKTVLPNPKIRDWDFSLSERTSNMLKNLERALWVTSYQMHYTGLGPANPLKMDDFKDKMITGILSHTAPLQERSHPEFVPSKPKQGCKRRQGRSTFSPSAAELLKAALNRSSASATVNQHGPREIRATYNEAPDPHQMGQSQSEYSSTEAQHTTPSQAISHKQQQTHSKGSAHEGIEIERERCKVQFDESFMRGSVSQSSQEANAAQISNTERPQDLYSRPHSQGEIEADIKKSLMELCGKDAPSSKKEDQPRRVKSHAELLSRTSAGQELLHGISNPSILPRPPVLPSIRPVHTYGNVRRGEAAQSLLDLQDSFSKTEAHRNFNSSITRAAVDLRDNVVRGRKHDFYGINCNYIHG
ncbi:uncharacterized protein C7orf31 [Acanthochromis polyacanthus]|uniref:uncharacterized protein C7orf31 n=1 Tax=Acanthochromis polyacanthus TaxID=80966 RepID=UPI002233E89A|nr:uncharacterized protein C7orf31 [Acanthochromis polyacanthus]